LTKRKKLLIATVVICAVLITGLAILRQGGPVTQAAIVNPYPGMVSYWQFNEGTGIVCNDSSGNGNTGIVYGTGAGSNWVTTGKFGYALSFDGTDNYVLSTNTITNWGSTVSFSAWVNIASFDTTQWAMIVGLNSNVGLFGLMESVYNGGSLTLWAWGNTLCTYPASASTWYYVAGVLTVVSSTEVSGTLYVNGAQVASGTYSGLSGLSTFPSSQITVGALPVSSYGYVNGIIEDVQTYNSALSATAIQTFYQINPSFSTNLLAAVPAGMTDFIATLSWQGTGSISATIQAPGEGTYTESNATGVYQKATYSVSGGTLAMLNIKRIEVSVSALSTSQSWTIQLATSNVQNYQISVETQT
jgi:hypothetical protein